MILSRNSLVCFLSSLFRVPPLIVSDENLFPFCAVNGGMLSSLPIDNSIDKQLYQLQQEQLQLPQDPLQQQHPQLQQLQQLQLQQIQQLQLQLLQQNEPEPLIPNPSLLGSEELSQNMLLSNSNLFSPHLAQYPFSAGTLDSLRRELTCHRLSIYFHVASSYRARFHKE